MKSSIPFQTTQFVDLPRTDALCAESDLRLLLLPNTVYAAIVHRDRKILSCKAVHNGDGWYNEVFLRYAFEKEAIFHGSYRSVQVFHASAPFALLPQEHDQAPNRIRYARHFLDELMLPSELGHVTLPSLHAVALFEVRRQTESLIAEYIEGVHHGHIGQLAVTFSHALAHSYPTHLHVHVLSDAVVVTAYKEARMLLCNRYPCRSAADVRYFVHAVCEVLGYDTTKIAVFASGEFEPDGLLYRELRRHLPSLQVPALLADFVQDMAPPFWKYALLGVQ